MAIYTSATLLEYNDGSWHTIPSSAIPKDGITGTSEMGQSDNGVGFGDESLTRCTIKVRRSAVASLNFARLLVRVTFTIGAGSQVTFVGEVASWSGDLGTVTWECESLLASLPGRTRSYYSKLRRRRPPFTKTTASSIEDPDNGSYQGGLGNELCWRAGLRPFEQIATYPTADGYYSFGQAIRAIDWAWVAGENGYDQVKQMAQAVGGQISAGMDGVIRYTSPLAMVGSVAQTFTLADFGKDQFSEQGAARDQYAKSFVMSYTPRRALNVQEVINDTTYRTVAANESLTVDLEPHYPIVDGSWVLDGGTLKDKNITITFFDGAVASYDGTTGWTATVSTYAMRLTIVITNHTSRHMQVSKIVASGQPVAPGEVETITVGSGNPQRVLPDNDFVQSKAHAIALATMALSFYGVARAVRTLGKMVFNTSRIVGETVALTLAELGLSAAPHIILAKAHANTGVEQSLTLVDAAGLPQLTNYWLVQSTSQSGTKKIAW